MCRSVLIFVIPILLASACQLKAKNENESVATPTQSQQVNFDAIEEKKSMLQPGDLLFRTGVGFASDQIRRFSERDDTYSHVGVIIQKENNLFVCSVEPADNYSTIDRIRLEPVDSFLNPAHNSGFGIFRPRLTENEKSKFLNRLDFYLDQNIEFDPLFNYQSDNQMYCSEMVSKALDHATEGRIKIRKIPITDPYKVKSIVKHFKKYKVTEKMVRAVRIITIDNLMDSLVSEEIIRVVYPK